MFSYVKINHKIYCPNCNNEVIEFQTKDIDTNFQTVEYWQCENFYSTCDACDMWIEFNLKREEIPFECYQMTATPSEVDESQLLRNHEGKIIGYTEKGKGLC